MMQPSDSQSQTQPSQIPQARIRVMVVDDHELIRCGVARIIGDEPDMEVVSQAESGEDAIEKLATVTPDIILMDVKMSGIGGVDATQRIVRAYPGMRVIAISALEVGLIPTRMLRAGAVAFITKCVSVKELLLAIRLVHSGERYITQRIATRLALNPFDGVRQHTPFDVLSERELQVALMLIDCHKVNKISDDLHLSPKTVYSYRYRIFEKLGLNSDVELTILAVKHGLSDADTTRITYE